MEFLGRKIVVVFLCVMLLFSVFSSASASASPAKIVSGVLSSSVAKLMKWVWSLKSTTKTAISGRSMMKYESGYNVETVFDGSKLGIEPYSIQLLPTGDLLILDSANSNLYTISSSLSLYSRPKLVAGSAEGYSGHVDGKHREAKMNHPKGVAVDDKGNIYVADTVNMAIRKISDAGIFWMSQLSNTNLKTRACGEVRRLAVHNKKTSVLLKTRIGEVQITHDAICIKCHI